MLRVALCMCLAVQCFADPRLRSNTDDMSAVASTPPAPPTLSLPVVGKRLLTIESRVHNLESEIFPRDRQGPVLSVLRNMVTEHEKIIKGIAVTESDMDYDHKILVGRVQKLESVFAK